MQEELECTLCSANTNLLFKIKNKEYFKCDNCSAILMNPRYYISADQEKQRYEIHNNDVNDPGYQKFVSPMVMEIKHDFNRYHSGLDYGAGTGPVITEMLRKENYNIELYDPFFWNDLNILNSKFDYIICCEVIEHFHFPQKEFKRLKSLLKPKGILYCMTEIYSEDIDFKQWYYKNDSTHVFFYHKKTLEWIKEHFGFSGLDIKNRLIKLFSLIIFSFSITGLTNGIFM